MDEEELEEEIIDLDLLDVFFNEKVIDSEESEE